MSKRLLQALVVSARGLNRPQCLYYYYEVIGYTAAVYAMSDIAYTPAMYAMPDIAYTAAILYISLLMIISHPNPTFQLGSQ